MFERKFGPVRLDAARLAKDEHGAAAMIFGLAFIPIILALGAAVDYTTAVRNRTRLNHLADSAALAAASASARRDADCAVNKVMSNCTQNAIVDFGKAAGLRFFGDDKNLRDQPGIQITKSNDGFWRASVTYTADVPTSVMRVAGFETVAVSGAATSQISLGADAYLNFHLLLDRSMSMGIGATATDIARLQTLTSCAFGCHAAGYEKKYYDEPKAQGIRFRIDDLRDATSALVSQAKSVSMSSARNHIKMGVYAFNHNVTSLVNMTADLAAVSTAVGKLDLPNSDDGSQLADALKWVSDKVTRNGNGLTDSSPIEIVFVVTDGVEDGIYTGWSKMVGPTGKPLSWWPKFITKANTGAFPPGACEALKEKGAIVAVVYTTYVPFVGTEQYDKLIGPFANNINPNLADCATPGYYFVASEPGDINKGMQSLFEKAIAASKLRLAQ